MSFLLCRYADFVPRPGGYVGVVFVWHRFHGGLGLHWRMGDGVQTEANPTFVAYGDRSGGRDVAWAGGDVGDRRVCGGPPVRMC